MYIPAIFILYSSYKLALHTHNKRQRFLNLDSALSFATRKFRELHTRKARAERNMHLQ